MFHLNQSKRHILILNNKYLYQHTRFQVIKIQVKYMGIPFFLMADFICQFKVVVTSNCCHPTTQYNYLVKDKCTSLMNFFLNKKKQTYQMFTHGQFEQEKLILSKNVMFFNLNFIYLKCGVLMKFLQFKKSVLVVDSNEVFVKMTVSKSCKKGLKQLAIQKIILHFKL